MNHKCPWCNSENTEQFLQLKDYFLTQEDFEIYKCKECELMFTFPFPTPSEIGKYYDTENYLSHNEYKKGLFAKAYSIVKKFNMKYKYEKACNGIRRGKILDIGCGVGDFLAKAKDEGWKIKGIELDLDARNQAEKKLKTIILPPERISELEDNYYDVVTMWHVLEHVSDLKEEISQLERLVKPGGRLVIAVPNHQSYDAKHYKDKWGAYEVPRHLYHFSQDAIANIFKDSQFKLEKIERMSWDSYYVSILSEIYCKSICSILKGIIIGWKSNRKAKKTGQWSSLMYVFVKNEPF